MSDQRIAYTEYMIGAGHPSLADTLNRLGIVDHNIDGTHNHLTVGSDADGDMYYRAAGVLARLAKGSANLKLFMNAGAVGPEWSSGVKVGSFTRDLTTVPGVQSVAAVGFKPSALLLIGGVIDVVLSGISVGFCDGSSAKSLFIYDTAGHYQIGAHVAEIYPISTANGVYANLSTWDADGFSLTWGKIGAPTETAGLIYLALR